MVALRGPGEYVGEMSIITQEPRMASLVAQGPEIVVRHDDYQDNQPAEYIFEKCITGQRMNFMIIQSIVCEHHNGANSGGVELPDAARRVDLRMDHPWRLPAGRRADWVVPLQTR